MDSRDFKTIRYVDRKKGPRETSNLAATPAHAGMLESYRRRCQEKVVEAKGGGDYPKTGVRNDPRKKQAG